uniref:non-specific serine/threonine protein kinase n=1 Tax=Xenopus tropicalis TaxID=8364 RepID=A0A1B8Y5L2_XENTR
MSCLLSHTHTPLREEPFLSSYRLVGKELGRGKFAVVRKCVELSSGKEYAAKFLRKRRKGEDCRSDIINEIAILEMARLSPYVVDLHEVYETNSEIVLNVGTSALGLVGFPGQNVGTSALGLVGFPGQNVGTSALGLVGYPGQNVGTSALGLVGFPGQNVGTSALGLVGFPGQNVGTSALGLVGFPGQNVGTSALCLVGFPGQNVGTSALCLVGFPGQNVGTSALCLVGFLGQNVGTSALGLVGFPGQNVGTSALGLVGFPGQNVGTSALCLVGFPGQNVGTSALGLVGFPGQNVGTSALGLVGFPGQNVGTSALGLVGFLGQNVGTSALGLVGFPGQNVGTSALCLVGFLGQNVGTLALGLVGFLGQNVGTLALSCPGAAGGEIFEQCVADQDEAFTEKDVVRLISQILQGVLHLHRSNVVHLDLKPQNILLTSSSPLGDIRIVDFGLSRQVDAIKEIREILGTPEYVAPEVLSYEPISTATDMWSVGVLTYVMLTGVSPFLGDTKQETFLNISQVNIQYSQEDFQGISEPAIDFIKSLLVKNPRKRIRADQCLKHPWLNSATESEPLKDTAVEKEEREAEVTEEIVLLAAYTVHCPCRQLESRDSLESELKTVRTQFNALQEIQSEVVC